MVFFALPTDLSLAILRDWMGAFEDVARLDAACARSVRKSYLALTHHPGCALPYELDLIDRTDHNSCIHWINTRGVKLVSILVGKQLMHWCAKLSRESLETVEKLQFDMFEAIVPLNLDHFQTLLMLVPRLECLDMGKFQDASGDSLLVLAKMTHLRLKTLKLDGDDDSLHNLPTVLDVFGSTLEVLRLGSKTLDDEMLGLLSRTCRRIKHLTLCPSRLTLESIVEYLGNSVLFPDLKKLDLRGDESDRLTNSLLLSICRAHPKLEYLAATYGHEVTLSTCATILALCPLMTTLITACYTFDKLIMDDGPDWRLVIHSNDDCVGLDKELPKITAVHPVNTFCGQWISNAHFDTLVAICGNMLRSLYIRSDLEGEIDPTTWMKFARTCTSVRCLSLGGQMGQGITDAVLMEFAQRFRELTEVSFCPAHASRQGIENFLQQIGSQLSILSLSGCAAVNDQTLLIIITHCPNLTQLELRDTFVTTNGIRNFLSLPNALNKLTQLVLNRRMINDLSEWRTDKMKTVRSNLKIATYML